MSSCSACALRCLAISWLEASPSACMCPSATNGFAIGCVASPNPGGGEPPNPDPKGDPPPPAGAPAGGPGPRISATATGLSHIECTQAFGLAGAIRTSRQVPAPGRMQGLAPELTGPLVATSAHLGAWPGVRAKRRIRAGRRPELTGSGALQTADRDSAPAPTLPDLQRSDHQAGVNPWGVIHQCVVAPAGPQSSWREVLLCCRHGHLERDRVSHESRSYRASRFPSRELARGPRSRWHGADVCPADGWLVGYGNDTTRRRNRTFQAGGCPALPVLKTGWATRPVPRRGGCYERKRGGARVDTSPAQR